MSAEAGEISCEESQTHTQIQTEIETQTPPVTNDHVINTKATSGCWNDSAKEECEVSAETEEAEIPQGNDGAKKECELSCETEEVVMPLINDDAKDECEMLVGTEESEISQDISGKDIDFVKGNGSGISGIHKDDESDTRNTRYTEDTADTVDTGNSIVKSVDESSSENKIESNLNRLFKLSMDEDIMSSDDEEYGDESDLLSVSSTLHNVTSLTSDVLPSFPTPLRETFWCEPCATSFRVRGAQYTIDRKKNPSRPSLFRLITVDLCEVEEPIRTGFCAHPKERVQQALRREEEGNSMDDMPPFILCVNIIVPGPPFYHLVLYYAVDDMSLIKPQKKGASKEKRDPINNIASKFFYGSSDKVRDAMFKLVPRIVSGNMIVKKAVGSKPTILGKKLTQSYIRDDRYLEVMVDLGSSVIAAKVVKLAKGYAKHLVVDMAFLLEGKTTACLPERILGTVRLTHVDFKTKLRFVKKP